MLWSASLVMFRYLVTLFVFAAVWVLWSWHFEPLIVGFGIVAVILTVLIAARLKVLDSEGEPFEINARLLVYLPWLAWQVTLSNLRVAKIILSPTLSIRPHLIRVPANQRTVLGQVIHANTITLTPGTISLDLRNQIILVHSLDESLNDEDDEGKTAAMINWLEKRVQQEK